MSIPNIGDIVTTSGGAAGAVWGVRENAEGIFVQFGADGEWLHLEASSDEQPASVVSEPAVIEVEHEAAPAPVDPTVEAEPAGEAPKP